MIPLIFDEARAPGLLEPDPAGPFPIILHPGEPRIARAAFEGNLPLRKSSYLEFSMHSPNSPFLRADIIGGDTGFPSVHLVNANGTVFRFARGNLKDFFDISRPNEPQNIRLPLSSFVYDRDLKSNVPLEGEFFEPGLTKLYLDFLRHPEEPIDIVLSDIGYSDSEQGGRILPDVQDLVAFQRTAQAAHFTKFSTRNERMVFALSLTTMGLALDCIGATLSLRLQAGDQVVTRAQITLRDETMYQGLSLPRPGAYILAAEITRPDGALLARSQWPIVRAIKARPDHPHRPTVLGLSDSYCYEQIGITGGTWDRIVVSTRAVQPDGDSFAFEPDADTVPVLSPGQGRKRIMAVFSTPKWLSSRPDSSDFQRYAPKDWGRYRDMVGWLAQKAWTSGVTHYEIWNEATALGHWAGSFDEMLRLHQETRDAVRAAQPGMTLLGGCTHSWTFDYLEKFLAAGGAETCDGLALHGYTYQPENYLENFERLEEMMEHHCPDRPEFGVYLSEIGFRTPAFSLDAQADWFTLFTLEVASRNRMEAILWFRYANPRPEISSSYRQDSSTGYALVGHQEKYCRPAYGAYVFLHNLLQRSDEVTGEGAPDARLYTVFCDGAAVARINGGREPAMRPTDWVDFSIQRLDPDTPGTVHIALDPDWVSCLS